MIGVKLELLAEFLRILEKWREPHQTKYEAWKSEAELLEYLDRKEVYLAITKAIPEYISRHMSDD